MIKAYEVPVPFRGWGLWEKKHGMAIAGGGNRSVYRPVHRVVDMATHGSKG